MSTDVVAEVKSQSLDELAEIVRQILGEDATPVGEMITTKIGRSAGSGTAGIFHVAGRAKTQTGETNWSAVVKALGKPENLPSGTESDAYVEVDVYRSLAFADVCGGVRAAHCYGIQPRDEHLLLWLEDLSYTPQPPWSADLFIATARHLGRFNAHWPEEALPQWDWLSLDGFRAEFTGSAQFRDVFERLRTDHDHELVRRFVSLTSVEALMQLWHDCDELLALAETTSKGICHGDCHPKNLFPMNSANGDGYTIGIDWVKTGIASYGIDAGHLLASPAKWLELTPNEAEQLREPILNAYLAGLADSGWSGNADGVRLTYLTRLACGAIRLANLVSLLTENPKFREQAERLLGRPTTEIISQWALLLRFYVGCKDEALKLADQVP